MLVVYPLLVSNSISPNIVPGLCKALERYLLIRILQKHALNVRRGNPRVNVGETLFLDELIKQEMLNLTEAPPVMTGYEKDPESWDDTDENNPKAKSKADNVNIKIGNETFKTIQLEPTYAEADDYQGKVIYGVKVVAFPINSSTMPRTIEYFQGDAYRNFIMKIVRRVGRSTISMMYRLKNRFLRIFRVQPTISGDPIRDIVFGGMTGATTNKSGASPDSIFVALSTGDIGNDITNLAKNVKRLMFVKWNSFIVCDEVKKEAVICLKSFNGLCSTLPYSVLMTGINKNLGQVYSDLEQLQTESRPFFRLRRPV